MVYQEKKHATNGLLLLCLLATVASACTGTATATTRAPSPTPVSSASSYLPPPHPTVDLRRPVKFKRISGEQGLSQSTVRTILQDRVGFLWFGTQDGLNKFDGYTFTIYKHDPDDPNSLSSSDINTLYEDHLGDLWIGTIGGGLNRLDRASGTFTRYLADLKDPDALNNNNILAVNEDKDGLLWIGTEGGGVSAFDRHTGKFIHYLNKVNDPNSVSSNVVTAVLQDASGMLWIGTSNGLDRWNRISGIFTHYRNNSNDPTSLSSNRVRSLYLSRSGDLWVGTDFGGVNRISQGSKYFTHYQNDPNDPNSLSSNRVRMVYESPSGTVWVGTVGGGLNRYEPARGQFIHYRYDLNDLNSLGSDRILSVLEDRSGALWVGTSGSGVSQLDWSSNQFAHYKNTPNDANSLSNNMVWALVEDNSGILWIGTDGGGLDSLDRQANLVTHYHSQPNNPKTISSNIVRSLLLDRAGRIWVGTDSGLDRLDPVTGIFSHYPGQRDEREPSISELITALCEDPSGMLWVGTESEGLKQFNPATEVYIQYYFNDPADPGSLASNNIASLAMDTSGTLWVGTDNGLDRLDRDSGRFIHFRSDPTDSSSLSDNRIQAIYAHRDGTLWIGTTGGLNRMEQGSVRFTHYREKNGLPSDTIYGILEDSSGYLWLSTNKGLSRFDTQKENFKNYDHYDGLQGNEFNIGAAYFSRDAGSSGSSSATVSGGTTGYGGEMFFGGINGVTAFSPGAIMDNAYIPMVVLTSLEQGGVAVMPGQAAENIRAISLTWPNNFFEFEFAALNYTRPEKNQYAYKLDNFDKDWNKIGTRRNGRYTNLPGGTYTLRVKGSNNDGIWNEEGIAIQVTIIPPLWQMTWFRWTAVLAILAVVFAGYRYRMRSVQQRNQLLAVQITERTREIEQRRQIAEGLREILLLLNSNKSLEESLNFIIRQVNRLMDAKHICIFKLDETGDASRPGKVITSYYGRNINPLSPATEPVLSAGEPALLAGEPALLAGEPTYPDLVLRWFVELVKTPHPRAINGLPEVLRSHLQVVQSAAHPWLEDIRTLLVLPIAPGGEMFGGLVVMFVEQKAFSQDELELFNSFAEQAALAVGNSALRAKAEELAVLSERSRLARDLHDAVTQTLFSASLIAEALPPLWEMDVQEGKQLLKELRQLTRGALAEMRSLLMELRPAAMVDARLKDLLQQLAEAFTGRTGTPVDLQLADVCRLPQEVHLGLYRIAQESMTNVVKHARASHVSLRLYCDQQVNHSTNLSIEEVPQTGNIRVILEVIDDGCGFNLDTVPPDHFGLTNLRERAQAIGAVLEITSQIDCDAGGSGTRVRAVWQGKEESDE